MEQNDNQVETSFQENGVIISDNKKENDTKVSVTIDSKMVHLKEIGSKSRFDRVIPLKHVASCEIRTKSQTALKWGARILALICILIGVSNSELKAFAGFAVLVFIGSFFIRDEYYVEIAASNGVPIKCKFEAKDKNDQVNERFVSIVRQLICNI